MASTTNIYDDSYFEYFDISPKLFQYLKYRKLIYKSGYTNRVYVVYNSLHYEIRPHKLTKLPHAVCRMLKYYESVIA